ncbi:hypothetical protein BJ165DRAFT_1528130 [Panaeolus papilionaceus]|nr:hypothetical protein BJ165DRAFT_1528130 [Panaeolus papilionaceus]
MSGELHEYLAFGALHPSSSCIRMIEQDRQAQKFVETIYLIFSVVGIMPPTRKRSIYHAHNSPYTNRNQDATPLALGRIGYMPRFPARQLPDPLRVSRYRGTACYKSNTAHYGHTTANTTSGSLSLSPSRSAFSSFSVHGTTSYYSHQPNASNQATSVPLIIETRQQQIHVRLITEAQFSSRPRIAVGGNPDQKARNPRTSKGEEVETESLDEEEHCLCPDV